MVSFSRISLLTALVLAIGLLSSGCGKSKKPTEPAGGYAAFQSAMINRDADGVWLTLSADTHYLFADVLDTLRATVDMVDKLQPSDRKEAREAIGAELLDTVETPRELFRYIFSSENIPTEAGYRAGLRPKRIRMDGEHRAVVFTAAGEEVELLQDEDNLWRVRSPLHEQFAEAFSAMEENRAQLETAINLFGAATNEEAEIARLLGTDDEKPKSKDDEKDETAGN